MKTRANSPAQSARAPAPQRAPFRRMVLVLALAAQLLLLVGPGRVPLVSGQGPDPIEAYFEAIAARTGQHIERTGETVTLTDATGDPDGGSDRPGVDIVEAGYGRLPEAPPSGMLATWMACSNPVIYCAAAGSDEARYANGWWVFWMELAGPVIPNPAMRTEYGVVMRQKGYATAPLQQGSAFGGGSHAGIARNERGSTRDQLLFVYQNNAFATFRTHARSRWDGMYVYVAFPIMAEVQADILNIDFYASSSDGTPAGTRRDNLRGFGGVALADIMTPADVRVQGGPRRHSHPGADRHAGPDTFADAGPDARLNPSAVAHADCRQHDVGRAAAPHPGDRSRGAPAPLRWLDLPRPPRAAGGPEGGATLRRA